MVALALGTGGVWATTGGEPDGTPTGGHLRAVDLGADPAGEAEGRPVPPSPKPSPSPTPKPSPKPKPSPSRPPDTSPAGWPGSGNTGWAHTGVALKPFGCTGDITEISTPGTVIDGRDVACGLVISTNNVTISRSRITSGADIAVRTVDGRTGIRFTDVEIVGLPGCTAGIGYMGWTALRVNIHGCGDGVRIEDGSTLQDSWIHDFWDGMKNGQQIDTPHHDGAQSTGGSNMTIRHNRIQNPNDQTSCILIGGEFGTPSNVLIENNYLDGGNYTIYLDPKGSNRVIRGNTFTRSHVYGPARIEGQVVWQANRYTDGAPVSSG